MRRKRFGDEPVTKPYSFVPFPRQTERRKVPGHERLELADHYSGRLTYRLKALTPIFVGTGSYALGEEVDFPQEQVVSLEPAVVQRCCSCRSSPQTGSATPSYGRRCGRAPHLPVSASSAPTT